MTLAIGLMSGTSADGVSAALCRIGPGRKIEVLRHRTVPYSRTERERILGLGSATAPEISEANFRIGRAFARAAKAIGTRGVRVIGSHGQTVHHTPGRHTLQIGEPSIIAEETGIDVVADFRPRDIAAGGQGAPLVPFFDDFIFGGTAQRRVLLNIGGIANLTVVGAGRKPIAFDTGPGNCLIDEAVRKASKGREAFDRNGRRAQAGFVDLKRISGLLEHPYFKMPPPKSTGRELFNRGFLARHGHPDIGTLTFFTAQTIADAIERFCPEPVHEVIVSGGGALNPVLMQHLEWMIFPAVLRPSTVYGIDVMAKECAAFALLAERAIRGLPNTIPSATGARRAVIAGKIVPGGNG